MPGDPLGAGGGVRDGEQYGELVAAESGDLGVLGQGLAQSVGDLEEQPVAGEVAEGVVDGPEAVEVDQDEGRPGAQSFGLVQRRPGALQQPLPVGEPRQRVAQLLLGAGAGDPQGGVQCDERYGEQRQQHRLGDGDDADQGAIPSSAAATSACRSRAVRATVGSPPPRGEREAHSRRRVTAR